MNIALVGAHPLPGEPSEGGVERVVQVLRRKLAESLHVSLIVPNARQTLRHTDEYGEISYLKRPLGLGFLSYWSWNSRAAFREIERLRPDIIHVQDEAGVALLWPARKKTRRRPMIFTAHGVLELDLMHAAGKDVLRRLTAPVRGALIGAVERMARIRYDEVIIINEYLLEAMPDVAGMRHHLIPNPVDEVFFSAPRVDRLSGQGYHLLQVGVVSPRKNVVASINIVHEMIRRGLNVHLHIIGPLVDSRYYRQCLNEIAQKHLESAITFHGNAEPHDVVAWMDRADALLLISKQETAPMVVAEAHCRGLPVAVPQAFGLRSMVIEGMNGIFLEGPTPADDALRVGELLVRTLDRDAIQRDAVSRYELGGIIDRTIDVYHEALGLALTRACPVEGV